MSVDQNTIPAMAAGTTVNADNPWPGLLAFRESDQGYFQGRQSETEELLRLVLRERLTVLFGLSGLGKSSLLQAGLFPELRQENIFPVYIRLDFSSKRPDLVAQILTAITREAAAHQIEAPPPTNGETLWEFFHRDANNFWNARNRPVMPLLVFDQFEEIFTLGCLDAQRSTATNALIEQLSDLAECRPPARLKAWLDEHPEEAKAFDFGRHYYEILLGIREDFLPDLETLRPRMPTVALHRMRLRRMNGEAALLAVNHAHHLIDPDVAEQVVRFVAADTREHPLAQLEIEPALLSVVCRELNNHRRKLAEPKITAGLLQGNQELVLADFYERSTADLPPEVRLFIEDHLLTVSGYRDNAALENALNIPGVTQPSIDALVERRLVRREDRGGSQRLELTHDLLVGVVRASRDGRRQREVAEKERFAMLQVQEEEKQTLLKAREEQRLELERVQAHERQERDRRDLRRLRIAIVGFVVLTLAAVLTATWAIIAQRQAKTARDDAIYSQKIAQQEKTVSEQALQSARDNAAKFAASLQVLSSVSNKDVQTAVDSQSASTLLPRVFIQIVNQDDRAYANQIRDRLIAGGVLVLGIQYVPVAAGLTKTDVRYYRRADEPEAQKIVDLLKSAGAAPIAPKYLPGYEDSTKVRQNHFEVWLANGSGSK
ncbi:hypothetical protein RBB77_21555 [Tunturibacter psychrotolerans]|uniref:Novel STAND NTPase 1 domain-containing protein n=1 Tax=Tunturiibacter psychrotolerans TaxID=3069686 RepID=A0AAU7ZPU3_9BACT